MNEPCCGIASLQSRRQPQACRGAESRTEGLGNRRALHREEVDGLRPCSRTGLARHLVPDTEGVKGVLEKLGSTPRHVEADIFEAKPRRDIPEREKPTPAQQRARKANIKKAQAARHAPST